MRRIFTLPAGCLMAFGLIGPAPCTAQATEANATFVVRATATVGDGATGAPNSWVLGKVKVGESKAFGVYVEGFSKILTAEWRGTAGPSDCIWRVDVRPQSVQIDTVRFELAWSRYEGAGNTARRIAGDTRVITLRKGKRHLFDFARAASAGSVFANLAVEVELMDVFDPQYPDLAIAYELSLVRDLGNGKTTSRVVRLSGKQGEERSFSFEIPFNLDGSEAAENAGGDTGAQRLAQAQALLTDLRERYSPRHPDVVRLEREIASMERQAGTREIPTAGRTTVKLRVTGAMSSRLNPDGMFDVKLHAERDLECGGGTVGSGTGSQGFRAANGETVGVEFPSLTGGCSRSDFQSIPPGARAGVTLRDGRLWIAFHEFFAGQKTALLVKVLRQRDP